MMNKQKKIQDKKAPKFGVFDAIIILLVILVVVGIYFRYNIVEWFSNSNGLGEYTLSYTIEDIRYTTPNFINIGDKVYFEDGNKLFGTFVEVSENMGALSITPASKLFVDSNGNIVEAFYPNSESRINANGKLICSGRYSEDGAFLVNGSTFISCGQSVSVYTEYVTVSIRIDAIEAVEAN